MNRLDQKNSPITPLGKAFRLDKAQGKLWGVCGGIANYLGIDATVVRISFIAATILGLGVLIPVYVAIALIAD